MCPQHWYTVEKIQKQQKITKDRNKKFDPSAVTILYLEGFFEKFERNPAKHIVKTAFRACKH